MSVNADAQGHILGVQAPCESLKVKQNFNKITRSSAQSPVGGCPTPYVRLGDDSGSWNSAPSNVMWRECNRM